ncbi:MAG: DUF4112 domain-containing protein [Thiohalomonadaceae bacterium]
MVTNAPPSREADLHRLRRLAHVLDEAVRLPGGHRIGVDGIVGVVPGVGDSLGAAVSAYIVTVAAQLGVPTVYLLRMILNIGLDLLVGLVPVLGDLFDFVWKANTRNLALIEQGIGRASRGKAGERRLIVLIVVLVALLIAAMFALSVLVVTALVSLVRG